MVYPVEKVLDDMHKAPDYDAFQRIHNYIIQNREGYTLTDYGILLDNASEIEEHNFNPKDCSQIRNIAYILRSGVLSNEYVNMGLDRSISLCSEARDLDIPLAEYLYELYPDLASYRVDLAHPSGYERELARVRHLLPTAEERRERRVQMPSKEEEEVTQHPEVAIDLLELSNRLKHEIEEMLQAAREENSVEMKRLRESINDLQSRIESRSAEVKPTPEIPIPEAKTITRVLDSSQYKYFSDNVIKLSLPVSQKRIARGEYQVSVTVMTPDEEQKALSFIAEAESHEKEITHRGVSQEYSEITDRLCKNFEARTDLHCGLNRTGSLATLARRLAEYAASQDTEWDKMFDLYSLELFPSGIVDIRRVREKKIYPAEMASEAFNVAISQVTGRKMAHAMEEEIQDSCDVELLQEYMLEYDAISIIDSEHRLPELPQRLIDKRNIAIMELTKCNYYPNNLVELRNEMTLMFENYGTDYGSQLSGTLDKLMEAGA